MIIHHGRKPSRASLAQFFFSVVSILVFNGFGLPSVVAATDCTAVAGISQAECEALVALYDNTNGPKWSDSPGNNWNVTNTPCSDWAGVVCGGGYVTEINRNKKNLTSSIPDLSALTQLTYLDLSMNQLNGPIPNLSTLTQLTELNLWENKLSGSIPDLSTLTELISINLSNNQLSGPIPNLSTLTQLLDLSLSGNQLTGKIPDWISTLTQLISIDLGFNQLSGPIPDLSTLTQLTDLDLNENQLSGPIPNLSTLTQLTYLHLSENQLSGPIPNLSTLTQLTELDLRSNQLSGPIPDLSTLTQLQWLDLDKNRLNGPIPDLSALSQLEFLWLVDNQLTGKIPDWISTLTQLTGLGIGGNQLSGGSIPDWISTLTHLSALDLSQSQLNGSIPDLSALTQLEYLRLEGNQLCGNIPSSLATLSNLLYLHIENNHLTTSDPTLITFLNTKNPDWTKQTPCLPENPSPPLQPLPPEMELTINFSGNGHGHVTTNPSGIDCKSNQTKCSHFYETAGWIKMIPTAAADSNFTGWSGWQSDCDDGEVFMSSPRSCTAYFELLRFSLIVSTVGQGKVRSEPVGINCGNKCQHVFDIGTKVTLAAVPEKGWQFQEWSGDCNNQGQVVIKENQACQATFFQLPSELPPIDNAILTAKILHLVILNGPKQLTGEPQTTLPIELELINGGPEADIYSLTVSDLASWNLTTLPASVSVAGLGHETLVLNVTLPAAIGEQDTITITATSSAEPTVTSSTEIVVAVVGEPTQPATTAVEVNKQPITTEIAAASNSEPAANSPVELPPVTASDSSTILAAALFSSLPPSTPPCYASGLVDWVCNAQGQILTNLIVGPNGMVSSGTLVGTLTNQGWVSNLTLEPHSHLTGGIVTGYIINHGEMADFEFRGEAIVGGVLAGQIINTSQVGGYFHDVQLAAGTHLSGGQLAGEISGDAQAPALLEDLEIQAGSYLQYVTIGNGVKLAAAVTLGEGVQFNHPSDDPRLVPKQLPQTLACDTQLPLLGVTAINTAGQVIETQCQCAGGVSVNGGSFEPTVKVRLSDTVEIRGTVCVAPEQLGQLADLVVYLDYHPLNAAAEEKQHYMLDSEGEVLPWDGQVAHLVAFQQTMLTAVQEVLLYQGQLATTGKLNLFFGYRLMDGTLISNNQAIEITITDK